MNEDKKWDVLTYGETMAVFLPEQKQLLRYVDTFKKGVAGAESNVAIGVARLGHSSCWISKVGDDELGEYILKEIRGEGVDVTAVMKEDKAPTGLMIKQFGPMNETSVFYYRKNSAASTLSSKDVRGDQIRAARIVHITGVTSALSDSCAEMNYEIASIAKKTGVSLSFDPNIRLKLWDKEKAKRVLIPLLELCDIVEMGIDEAEILLGTDRTDEIIRILREMNIKKIAIKMGSAGAIVADINCVYKIPAYKVSAVDNIGAGDAFVAGFLCGIIERKELNICGKMGALMGAQAVTVAGDIEGFPDRRKLDMLMHGIQSIHR
ncbi:PfkB family carbohydrate kinase [Mordavella massiliensis]|uniref:sugar kinase n=1 Tax=Mordavella massiliensis TaxID=1871024 RepID=UPI00210906F0|nr:sugar kinase [Mordavella massiliensis]